MIHLQVYVVQSGDTLYQLARRFEVPMEELVYLNQLRAPGRLSVGQALAIPEPRFHIVEPGDSLYTVAKRYRISLRALIEANPQIKDPDRILPGQKIALPIDTLGARSRGAKRLVFSGPQLSLLSAFS